MRANIEEYKAVEEAAMKFVKSVAEGDSKYAKDCLSTRLCSSATLTASLSMEA